jgi:chitin disaccharide deacetylase
MPTRPASDDELTVGLLIVNADDWGRDAEITDRILDCVAPGAVSAVSAMVFMQDSERAAGIARERGVEAGLHLNFTTPFTGSALPAPVIRRQQQVSRYLRRHRLAPYIFNPRLASAFEYLVAAQLDEYRRLYGADPAHINGHHHMHLCANVLAGRLLPTGTFVRRNFCFEPGEKSVWNRLYRRAVDRVLARRHRLTDLFFSLEPLEPRTRLQRICSVARTAVVELETHPVQPDEYRFLRDAEILRHAPDLRVLPHSAVLNCHATQETR